VILRDSVEIVLVAVVSVTVEESDADNDVAEAVDDDVANVKDFVEVDEVGVVSDIDERVVVVVGKSHKGLSCNSRRAHKQVLGLWKLPPLVYLARSDLSSGCSIRR
jgi:hypothetical protein